MISTRTRSLVGFQRRGSVQRFETARNWIERELRSEWSLDLSSQTLVEYWDEYAPEATWKVSYRTPHSLIDLYPTSVAVLLRASYGASEPYNSQIHLEYLNRGHEDVCAEFALTASRHIYRSNHRTRSADQSCNVITKACHSRRRNIHD